MSPEEWRRGRKLSQEALARLLGLSGKNPARTWQRWESGDRQPPLSIIAKVEALSDGRVTTRSWLDVRSGDKGAPA